MSVKQISSLVMILALVGVVLPLRAESYRGAEFCLDCHANKASYMNTLHPKKVQGPPTVDATPVLRTIIDGEEVSIFDPRTEGYDQYVAPWADYFNEGNVAYTIGSYWKQRFMTKVVPETVDGTNYSGQVHLPDNDFVVMGIQWNVAKQRWQNYEGPTKENSWFTQARLTRKKCSGCHTTGFDPVTGTWADMNSSYMQKGVTCESCHGPGMTMLNPKKDLNFIQKFELCGSCHGRGSSVAADGSAGPYGFPYSDALGRGYQPGDKLSDFYIQTTSSKRFWANGQAKSHHEQYNDSLLSKHFKAKVGCMDCHDVHKDKYEHLTKLPGNRLCTSCHSGYADATAYRMHSAHDPETTGCVDCHMPYTAKTINPYDIRSHSFRPIAPAETIADGAPADGFSGSLAATYLPNSCNSSCHNGIGPGPLKTNALAQLGFNYIQTLQGHVLEGDLNYDGTVNLNDLAILSGNWLKEADED